MKFPSYIFVIVYGSLLAVALVTPPGPATSVAGEAAGSLYQRARLGPNSR
jgi:hypothetical protein